MRARMLSCLAGVAAICLATPALVRAQAPTPAWRVASLALPTELSALEGGQFDIRVTNVGGGESDGSPITVTDTLPAGLTTAATPKDVELDQSSGGEWNCTPAGAGRRQVVCEYEPIQAGAPVAALEQLPALEVPVRVGAVAPDTTLTNTVAVSGGGAASVEETSNVVVEAPDPSPFGFEFFENYLADPAGAPATQASGSGARDER